MTLHALLNLSLLVSVCLTVTGAVLLAHRLLRLSQSGYWSLKQ